MEDKDNEGLATLFVPGPELRTKIDNFAARLSAKDKRGADEMIAKVLSSNRRDQFLYAQPTHILYPYFLVKLSEYRNHPEMRPATGTNKAEGAAGSGAAAAGASAASTTTTTNLGGIVRTVGGTAGGAETDPKRLELLRTAEQEAKRYLHDPFPNHYSLDLKSGTIDMPALVMDVLSCTAQYTAKYGNAFLSVVQSKQKNNPAFRFLHNDDIRHGVFQKLVESYKRILRTTAEEAESRLEKLESSQEYILDVLVEEKTKYAKAAVARRKAALLTDEELRAKLQWGSFKVIKSFTLSDLMLDGVVPATALSQRHQQRSQQLTKSAAAADGVKAATTASSAASLPSTTIQPPGGASAFAPVYMSANLVHSTTDAHRKKGGRASGGRRSSQRVEEEDPTAVYTTVDVVENYTPNVVAPVRRGVDFFVDGDSGRKVSAEALQRSEQPREGGSKRGRETEEGSGDSYGLATEAEMASELRRRATEQ